MRFEEHIRSNGLKPTTRLMFGLFGNLMRSEVSCDLRWSVTCFFSVFENMFMVKWLKVVVLFSCWLVVCFLFVCLFVCLIVCLFVCLFVWFV